MILLYDTSKITLEVFFSICYIYYILKIMYHRLKVINNMNKRITLMILNIIGLLLSVFILALLIRRCYYHDFIDEAYEWKYFLVMFFPVFLVISFIIGGLWLLIYMLNNKKSNMKNSQFNIKGFYWFAFAIFLSLPIVAYLVCMVFYFNYCSYLGNLNWENYNMIEKKVFAIHEFIIMLLYGIILICSLKWIYCHDNNDSDKKIQA